MLLHFLFVSVLVKTRFAENDDPQRGSEEENEHIHKTSYAQQGDDLVLKKLFYLLFHDTKSVRYLDIGCNSPTVFSNTYLFYKNKGSGVLVDANPAFKANIEKVRPKDVFVNAGVIPETVEKDKKMKFYNFVGGDGYGTFSPDRVAKVKERFRLANQKVNKIEEIYVAVVGINDLLGQYFQNGKLDLLSIDVEGLDVDILKAWDYEKYRPKLIIMEPSKTELSYSRIDFIKFMELKEYILVADTFVNFIFADKTQINFYQKRISHLSYNGVQIQNPEQNRIKKKKKND